MYLRELPEPLIPYEFYRPLLDIQNSKAADEEKVAKITEVMAKLPMTNKLILWNMALFCSELIKHEKTKMTIDNVAICVGPSLMWCRPEDMNPKTVFADLALVNSLMRLIILNKTCIIV